MATVQQSQPAEQVANKGLKSGALGLLSTTVIATASVAPAYSMAATLAEQGRSRLRDHVHVGD